MRLLLDAGAVALLLVAVVADAGERLTDPTRAFVEGYDPSGNDFFANVPERTVLLRIRADFDNDGIADIALSESSTWGNAGGQWLLFRGQSDGSYVYWATLFFSPGAASVRALARGTSEMTLYVRMGASRGSVYMYRVTSAESPGSANFRSISNARAIANVTTRFSGQSFSYPSNIAGSLSIVRTQRTVGGLVSGCGSFLGAVFARGGWPRRESRT